MQWKDSIRSQYKGIFSTSHSISLLFSSLDLIACVAEALCKTRVCNQSWTSLCLDTMPCIHPSSTATYPSSSFLKVKNKWLCAHRAFLSCYFSKGGMPFNLLLCFLAWDIKSIFIALSAVGMSTSSGVFGGKKKELGDMRSNINNHGKNKREFFITKPYLATLKQGIKILVENTMWTMQYHSNSISLFLLMSLISLSI